MGAANVGGCDREEAVGTRSEVIVVSDGTGDTATAVVKAVMLQFQTDWKLRVFGGIRHVSEVRRVVDQAAGSNALLVFSLVDKQVAAALLRATGSRGVPTVDLLGALIGKVAQHLRGTPTSARPVARILRRVFRAHRRRRVRGAT